METTNSEIKISQDYKLTDSSGKVVVIGTFENGILKSGELFEGDKWFIGTFIEDNMVKLVQEAFDEYKKLCDSKFLKKNYKLHGYGKIYSGYDKNILVSIGVYDKGRLISGEYLDDGKWVVGRDFNIPHKDIYLEIYTDSTKTVVVEKGIFDSVRTKIRPLVFKQKYVLKKNDDNCVYISPP